MKLKDIMTADPEMIRPEISIREAAEKMKECGSGILAVGRERDAVGMITDRDIVLRCIAEGKDPEETTVMHIMTEMVYACDAETSLAEAFGKMREHHINHLLVTDEEGLICGMVSLADVIEGGSHLHSLHTTQRNAA